jgi:hypothetical protein
MNGWPKIVPRPIASPDLPAYANTATRKTIISGREVNRGDKIADTKDPPNFMRKPIYSMALTNMSADMRTRAADMPSANGTGILSNYSFFVEAFTELMPDIIPDATSVTSPGRSVWY